jgi:hypothetical protein
MEYDLLNKSVAGGEGLLGDWDPFPSIEERWESR